MQTIHRRNSDCITAFHLMGHVTHDVTVIRLLVNNRFHKMITGFVKKNGFNIDNQI